MSRRASLWSVAPFAILTAVSGPAFAERAPIEQTLNAFGLTATKGGVLQYDSRSIMGDVVTYAGVKLGEARAQSLVVTVSAKDGPGSIESARLVGLSGDDDTIIAAGIEVKNPSQSFFKAPLEGVLKGPSDFDKLPDGFSASSIHIEGISVPDDTMGDAKLGLIRIDGFAIRNKKVEFSKFEVAGLTGKGPGGERFALGRFVVSGPNDALMRALFSSSENMGQGKGDDDDASANPLAAFDGASAKEWRLEGLEVDIPKSEPKPPSVDDEYDDEGGATPVSFDPDDESEASDEDEEERTVRAPPPAPFGPMAIRLGTFAIEDQQGDTIGRVLVQEFSAIGEAPFVEKFNVSMGELSIRKLDLGPFLVAARSSMDAAAEKGSGKKPKAKPPYKSAPDSGLVLGYEAVDLKAFQMSAAGLQLDLGSTSIWSRKDEAGRIIGYDTAPFSYSFRVLDPKSTYGAMVKANLDVMGYKDITIAGPGTVSDYIPATDELFLPGGSVGMKDGFLATFAYSFLGFRDYFDKTINGAAAASTSPAAALEAFGALKIKSLSFSFQDQSLVGRIAKLAAPKDGSKTAEAVRAEWVKAASDTAKGAKPGSIQRIFGTAAADFLRTPNRTLQISLLPPKPIGLAELGAKEPDPKAIGLSISVK
jgi:hypothetical protein